MSTDRAMPLVSIIVPAFNAGRTVADSVRSASRGSYENIEIIIVDDGSIDGTGDIARRLADEDPRIRLIRQENRGLSAALNAGFDDSNGDYLARLDADDLWHSDKLARQMELARSDPSLALIACRARYIDGDERVTSDGPAQDFPRWALCRGYCESLVGGGSSAVMKRSAIREAGGCDERLRGWEDLLLQLAISARHAVAILPAYLVSYRISEGSMTRDLPAMLGGWRAVRARIADRFPQIPGRVHRWAHARRIMMFAEGFAWRGDYARSALLIGEAKLVDPAWSIRFLGHRLRRRWRKAEGAEGAGPGPGFFDCDPDQAVVPPTATSAGRLARFEQRRDRWLADLDRRIAPDGGGE